MVAKVETVISQTFDYVVVGGGTAGLTLGARLSEDSMKNVLVLEAGEPNIDDLNLLRPAGHGSHFGNKLYCWDHETIAQKHSSSVKKGWQRGKGLGGSSAINFMCYTKPPAKEIDDLETLGNPGWNWKTYQEHLSKSEGFIDPSKEIQEANSINTKDWKVGRQGPLKITYPGTIIPIEHTVQKTLINAGVPIAKHPLDGDPHGAHFTPNTYDPQTHTRSYATTAFYLPNKDRPNFSVLTSAHGNRIITERNDKGELVATGVEFTYADKKTYTVKASKEVILSSGTLKSAQILELSGIGRKDVLDKIGVPVKVDLPGVGENVQEHYFVGTSWALHDDSDLDTIDTLRDPEGAAKQLELYKNGAGLFTTGIIGFAFISLKEVTKNYDSIVQGVKDKILNKLDSFPSGTQDQYKLMLKRLERGDPECEFITIPGFMSGPSPPSPGKKYITVLSALNHPFSRGTIHSISNDPKDDPEFDAGYFEQDVDLQIILEQVKFTRKLENISPLKDVIAAQHNPGPNIQSDDDLKEWIKQTFSTTWHTSGSCSMLPKDKGGVVDPDLKVYGTANIRVVDLSILPLQFSSHTLASVYAIAEIGAEKIKAAA
ncbi:alcohol oxidase [Abortiporus biennis]|nr:alcohol oxidase [Abortiporus biennis]